VGLFNNVENGFVSGNAVMLYRWHCGF